MKKKRAATDRMQFAMGSWNDLIRDWSKFHVSDSENSYEIWSWCTVNCRGKFDMKTNGDWFIERENDAVLFALRWT